jgi:peptidoglycan LD-endopeptidase LytH
VRRPRTASLFLVTALVVLAACGAPLTRGVAEGAIPPTPRPMPSTAPTPRAVAADARARADRRISDEDLELLSARALMVPVDGVAIARVPDTFDALRTDGNRGTRAHAALDILAPRGTAVIAADDAVIGRLSTNALGGITIYLRDLSDRFVHYYAHLERYRDGLTVGDTVRKGAVVGFVGTTGNAPRDTPHLHWQLMRRVDDRRWWDGIPLNPWHFLAVDGRALDAPTTIGQSGR